MKKNCSPQEASRLAVYGQEVLEGLVGGPDLPHLAHQVRSDLEGGSARLHLVAGSFFSYHRADLPQKLVA
jgi:hypothetical protein